MSKVCEKCGKKPVAGRSYARRGLAKYKGGVGRKVTGITNRTFSPNVQSVRVREPNGTVHRVRLCTKCLKTATKNGTIVKASRKPRPSKKVAVKVPAPVVDEQADRDARALEPEAGPDAGPSDAGPSDAGPSDDGPSDDGPFDDGPFDDDEAADEQTTT